MCRDRRAPHTQRQAFTHKAVCGVAAAQSNMPACSNKAPLYFGPSPTIFLAHAARRLPLPLLPAHPPTSPAKRSPSRSLAWGRPLGVATHDRLNRLLRGPSPLTDRQSSNAQILGREMAVSASFCATTTKVLTRFRFARRLLTRTITSMRSTSCPGLSRRGRNRA